MNDLMIISHEQFGGIDLDVYRDRQDAFFMTREQIGEALSYADPIRSISRLHNRNTDRLDPLSTVVKLTTVEGDRSVSRDTTIYALRGVMEICRLSRQPKADAFMDFVWDVMEGLYKGEIALLRRPVIEESAHLSLRAANRTVEEAFISAILDLLESGQFYLYPMGSAGARDQYRYGEGHIFPLGRFDDDHVYICSSIAYDAYWRRSKAPAQAKDIYARLAASGLIETSPKSKTKSATWSMQIEGASRSMLKFRRGRVNIPVPPTLPVLPPNPAKKKRK